jgi:hypothetical protein
MSIRIELAGFKKNEVEKLIGGNNETNKVGIINYVLAVSTVLQIRSNADRIY